MHGRFLAIVTEEGSTGLKIWIRSLDGLDARLLTDVQGPGTLHYFGLGDGEQLAYQLGDKLYKIARIGGPPVVLADAPERIQQGVWLDGGIILFGTARGLFRVSSSGGAPVKLVDQAAESPAWLPHGRFLYVRAGGIFAGSLSGGEPVAILPERAAATYVLPLKAGLPGQLLFIRSGTLLAQPFDAEKLAPKGDPVPVEECASKPSAGDVAFTASTNGVLVCGGGNPQDVVLTWLDRAGKKLRSVGKPFRLADNPAIRLSPDDSQAIVTIRGPTGVDLWIADLNRETVSRFTFEGSLSALWSPDGRSVVWAANDRNRYLKSADGSGKDELLYQDPKCNSCYLEDWSADGKLIAFAERGEKAVLDIWLVPVDGDRKPYPYLQSRFATYWAQISPDSRWMAYGSDQSPHPEQVFVASIPWTSPQRVLSNLAGPIRFSPDLVADLPTLIASVKRGTRPWISSGAGRKRPRSALGTSSSCSTSPPARCYDSRERYGKVNEHNGWVRRDFWLEGLGEAGDSSASV